MGKTFLCFSVTASIFIIANGLKQQRQAGDGERFPGEMQNEFYKNFRTQMSPKDLKHRSAEELILPFFKSDINNSVIQGLHLSSQTPIWFLLA